MLEELKGKECVAFKWNRGPYRLGTAALIVVIREVSGRLLKVDVVGCIEMSRDDSYSSKKNTNYTAFYGLHRTNGLYINFGELGPLTLLEDYKKNIDDSLIVRW